MSGEGLAKGPDGPSQSGVAHGFGLIPASLEKVSRSVEVSNRRKKGSEYPGVTWRADEMLLENERRFRLARAP